MTKRKIKKVIGKENYETLEFLMKEKGPEEVVMFLNHYIKEVIDGK